MTVVKEESNPKDNYMPVKLKNAAFFDEVSSANLEYTDFTEGNLHTDVYILCSKANGVKSYKLGFVSDSEEYQYCKIESQNGRLGKSVIHKYGTIQYEISKSEDAAHSYIDILNIKYYDANDKLLKYQSKYVCLDEISGTYYMQN